MMGSTLLLMLMLITEALRPLANPVDCQESEYLDPYGKCAPCRACGPGLELSKECGYGEGSDAHCTPCPPRRFKDSWGHHGCKPCLSCSLINRIQRSKCTATANAVCGECYPGFYSKTQIGGLQDLECIPCTKQTPPSEPQCRSVVSLMKAETPAGPSLGTGLVVLTSSALVIVTLVSLLSLLYCQRFWKSQCQRVFLRTQDLSGQRVLFQASARPAGFPHHEQRPDSCFLGIKNFSPLEGPVDAVQFLSEGEALGFHLPRQQPEQDFSKPTAVSAKVPRARRPLETQPLLRHSGCSDCSAGGSSFTELRLDSAGDPSAPAPLSSCATAMHHPWSHTPVECTELDLQNFSTQSEDLDRDDAEKRDAWVAQRGRTELVPACCEADPAAQARLTRASSLRSCPSFRSPAAESGEQLSVDAQSLVTETRDIT